jgi:large subunit ribosomal protein L4
VSTIDIVDAKGGKAGSVDLPAEIFDAQVNIPLIHQVVVAQQAAARQGTASTKTRGEVAGGGSKPYRQKGTGRARQGSIRAPQFAGGGIVHGPTPRTYDQRTPKKMKAAALRGALSDRAREGRVHIIAGVVDGDTPSTRSALGVIAKLTSRPRTLGVLERGDDVTWLSLRNVDTIHVLAVDQLNTYDVLLSDDVVFTKGAYDAFVSGPATGKSVKAVATSTEAESLEVDQSAEAAKRAKKAAAKSEDAETKPTKKAAVKKAEQASASAAQAESDEDAAPPKKAAAKKTATQKTAAKKATAKKAAPKKATATKSETADASASEVTK